MLIKSKTSGFDLIRIWLAILTISIVILFIIGVATRLTDSGLSITEWNVFSGIIPPLSEVQWSIVFEKYKQTSEFQKINFTASLSDFKYIFWYEWLHRFWARFAGILLIIPALIFWLTGRFSKVRRNRLLVLVLLFLLQGFIGWYMVQSGLTQRVDVSPYRLTLHFGLALLILALTLWEALRNDNMSLAKDEGASKPNILPAFFLVILLYFQLLAGAMVAGSHAGKIYNSWPLIEGVFIPEGIFQKLDSFDSFATDLLTIQFMHRMGAYIVISYVLFYALWYFIRRSSYSVTRSVDISVLILLVIVFVQASIGVLLLLSTVSFTLSITHHILAIIFFMLAVYHLQKMSDVYTKGEVMKDRHSEV